MGCIVTLYDLGITNPTSHKIKLSKITFYLNCLNKDIDIFNIALYLKIIFFILVLLKR